MWNFRAPTMSLAPSPTRSARAAKCASTSKCSAPEPSPRPNSKPPASRTTGRRGNRPAASVSCVLRQAQDEEELGRHRIVDARKNRPHPELVEGRTIALQRDVAASETLIEPAYQPRGEHAGDAAPVVAGRERRLHRHDLIAHQSVEAGEHAIIERAAAQAIAAGEQHRPRIRPRDRDAELGQGIALATERHRDARHRILDRAADADLVIARAQAGPAPGARGDDDFARAQRQIILAVARRSVMPRMADIELAQRQRPPSRRTGNLDLALERQQRRREITAEGGEADAAALGRDMTDRARGLEAMIVGLSPPFALVVVDAARVEAEIAADGAHLALRRAGDRRRSLGQHPILRPHLRMSGKLGQGHGRTDAERVALGLDAAQLGDAGEIDEDRRCDDAAAEIDDEIRAAAQELRPAIGFARGQRLRQRLWPQQPQLGQGVHQATFALARLARTRSSSAAKTRSGVTGSVSKRSPTASAMALASAGRNAASDPSPASFAPKGPCGSLLSTMPTSIGGESSMVGTR